MPINHQLTRYFYVAFILLALTLSGCATAPANSSANAAPSDPFESINRPFWTFTWDYADKYVLRPAALAYTGNMPVFIRTGLYNMALNLNEPSTIINDLLQLKFSDAATSTGRFILNSTIGLFGFFDPASDFDWNRKPEEFGEVLGHYGVGDGPYLVVPVLGPSAVREEVGDYVDRYYWPLAVIDFWPNIFRAAVIGLEKRAELVDQEKMITESIDPYEFVKNAYFQNMRFNVYDGKPPVVVDEEAEAELESYLDEYEDN